MWPLAMVSTFPNQVDQCFKNFPNNTEKKGVPTLKQEKIINTGTGKLCFPPHQESPSTMRELN